jgi:hypothetical protein
LASCTAGGGGGRRDGIGGGGRGGGAAGLASSAAAVVLAKYGLASSAAAAAVLPAKFGQLSICGQFGQVGLCGGSGSPPSGGVPRSQGGQLGIRGGEPALSGESACPPPGVPARNPWGVNPESGSVPAGWKRTRIISSGVSGRVTSAGVSGLNPSGVRTHSGVRTQTPSRYSLAHSGVRPQTSSVSSRSSQGSTLAPSGVRQEAWPPVRARVSLAHSGLLFPKASGVPCGPRNSSAACRRCRNSDATKSSCVRLRDTSPSGVLRGGRSGLRSV